MRKTRQILIFTLLGLGLVVELARPILETPVLVETGFPSIPGTCMFGNAINDVFVKVFYNKKYIK